jgi:hypothetical protein
MITRKHRTIIIAATAACVSAMMLLSDTGASPQAAGIAQPLISPLKQALYNNGASSQSISQACTASNLTQLTNLVNNANSGCTTVLIPENTVIEGRLDVTRAGVSIQGASRTTSIFRANSAGVEPVINIKASNVSLVNFTLVGLPGSYVYFNPTPAQRTAIEVAYNANSGDNTRQRLVGVQYTVDSATADGVTNIKIIDMNLLYAGRECIRIKNNSNTVEIRGNYIEHCGGDVFGYDGVWRGEFELDNGAQVAKSPNGEAIYVGSDLSKQRANKKNDAVSNVTIHNNVIRTFGAECVESKERSVGTKVIANLCTDSGYSFQDPYKTCDGPCSDQWRPSAIVNFDGNDNSAIGNALCTNLDKTSQFATYAIRTGDQVAGSEIFGRNNRVTDNLIAPLPTRAFEFRRPDQSTVCGNRIAPGVTQGSSNPNPIAACNYNITQVNPAPYRVYIRRY